MKDPNDHIKDQDANPDESDFDQDALDDHLQSKEDEERED
jgi:hypothetical protein